MADPVLLLAAGADRVSLIARLRELRAQPDLRTPGLKTRPTVSQTRLTEIERVAIVATADAMPAAIDAALERLPSIEAARLVQRQTGFRFTRGATPGRVAFVFPGQGSEHRGMLRALRARSPIVAAWFDAMDAAATAMEEARPTRLLDAPDAAAPPDRQRRAIEDRETSAQLGSIAALALHDLLGALGVRGDLYVGHSNGEHPALIASGRVGADRAEICRGFVEIGRISARLARPGRERMAALSLADRDRLIDLMDRAGVYLAMDNCPGQLVAGGDAARIDALARDVIAAGGVAMTLPFTRAYHTPLFADQAEAFGAYYGSWRLVAGSEEVWSCFNETPIPADPDECRRVMTAQWTSRVRFRTTLERLHDEGVRTFVEVGPDARLSAFVEDTLRGRPHVALSASSIHRGEVEQILHLLADLFVAGVPIDPSRVADALPPPDTSPEALAVEIHRRLIDDARERLARMSALAGAASIAAVTPLAGSIVASTGSRVELERTFTREADPFVDEHALGRRHPADPAGSYPLPVLSFTASLEIVAEAARAFGQAGVTEIRNARASRWLALDRGRLDVSVVAERREEGIGVSITAQGDDRAGFDATVFVDAIPKSQFPTPKSINLEVGIWESGVDVRGAHRINVPRDSAAAAPRAWTAKRFYEEYAFHLGAFRGLERVTAVGPHGVEAALRAGRMPGLAADRLTVDPAMLDCAGQLVAFWILEHEGHPPTFGVFPFQARRVVVHARPPAPGSPATARAWIVRQPGMTTADVAFTAADGSPIVTVQGFMQRLVEFPEWFARRVFAGDPSAMPAASSADDRAMLETSWGIWARALAHLSMGPAELAAWYRAPAGSARIDRLFAQLEAGWRR